MPEREVIQPIGIRELCIATLDTARLHKNDPERLWVVSSLLLANLKSAFPELTNRSLKEDTNLELFNNMSLMGIWINDCFDLTRFAEENSRIDLVQNSFSGWEVLQEKAINSINRFPYSDSEREVALKVLDNYQKETVLVETEALKREGWNLANIKDYREITNAIALVNISSVALGFDKLEGRLISHSDIEPSLESIKDKYLWLLEANPANETEKRLVGLFNIVMAIQTIDDARDRVIDEKLGLHTFGTQNEIDIKCITNDYLNVARLNGVSSEAIKAQISGFKFIKKTMEIMPQRIGGVRERLFNPQI